GLVHEVAEVIHQVHDVVDDGDAVGTDVDAFAPRLEEATIAVVDDDRVLAAVEDVDAVLGVGGNAGDVAVLPALRQLLPVLVQLVAKVSLSEDHASVLSGNGAIL